MFKNFSWKIDAVEIPRNELPQNWVWPKSSNYNQSNRCNGYCNGIRTHNHLVRKRTLNYLAKLTKWLSCVVHPGCISKDSNNGVHPRFLFEHSLFLWLKNFLTTLIRIFPFPWLAHLLSEKCPNTEFFVFRIFLYSEWIQENTEQRKLRI